MADLSSIKVLLLDLGGVLLTDGWETHSRERAAAHFSIDFEELNTRHRNIFDAWESGKMTMDNYLQLLVFYQERPFTAEDFKNFMLAESQPFPDMIQFIAKLKQHNTLRIAALNNEPLELNEYRIDHFGLAGFIDFFISSCYVNVRKPDRKIYDLALQMAHVKPQEVVYVDDREVYIEFARTLGINTIHHVNLHSTQEQLRNYGLQVQPEPEPLPAITH